MATPEAQREYQRQWVARRRAEFFADKECVKCGSTDRLELDHIDPEAKVSHRIWSWSAARREVEIAKCQVLCHECHLFKTVGHLSVEIPHGTHTGFSYHGCKCDDCREGQRIYNQQWRASR